VGIAHRWTQFPLRFLYRLLKSHWYLLPSRLSLILLSLDRSNLLPIADACPAPLIGRHRCRRLQAAPSHSQANCNGQMRDAGFSGEQLAVSHLCQRRFKQAAENWTKRTAASSKVKLVSGRVSRSSPFLDSAWRRRQTIKRGSCIKSISPRATLHYLRPFADNAGVICFNSNEIY
jgi:hypothetical protein